MYSDFDVRQQIDDISNGEDSPIRKARRLITLSRELRRFSRCLRHGAEILELDSEAAALERLQATLSGLHRLHDEARLAAFRALKAGPSHLGFEVRAEQEAYPRWARVRAT